MVIASHTDQTDRGELCFRKLIEHSYAGVTLLDGELTVVYRSPSAERITGWSLANRTKQAVNSLIHPDDGQTLHQVLSQVYAHPGKPVTTRFRTRHYAGHYITIDCTLTNLLCEPEVKAIVLNFIDVTTQVKLEAEEQQSRNAQTEASQKSVQLEALLGSITDGFFTADAKQCYTYVNRRICEMVGLTPQEMIGRRVWDVFPDAVGSTTYHSIQQALQENRFVRSEDYYAPLGLWQENRVYPGTDGFSMFIQDVTGRKKADEQLRLLFDRAPDMIGILGLDRYFKKVNPAMCSLLEYTEKQLLDAPLDLLVHPDDLEVSRERTKAFIASCNQTMYFENRFLTKSGKAIWLSWTVTRSVNEKLLFCVGKNISDKKEIENLLHKANQLARIGSWEVDRVSGTAYWSPITREIYEVPDSFTPSVDNWLSFYRQGADRDYIAGKMADTIVTGVPCDAEVELVTARGNLRWVRAMAEAEFRDGKCVRVYGSFQDIDHRKRAELAATTALAERNAILESIGDGFFAVDRNWIVTYWNATAEKNTGKPRETMLGKYFWDIYEDVWELDFYRFYQQAMLEGTAVHFEDFYPAMQAWFTVSAYPSENGLSVYFRDISESKRTMQALAESEKRYSDLFQLSPQPMFVYAVDTLKYLDVNAAAIAHYGYSHEEFLDMTILDIRPAEDIPLVQQTVRQHVEQEKVILHGIFRHRKKNGELINVDIQSNAITYQGIKAKVVLANDVTERMRYIQAIEAQNKKLREISWMQSHVIRAPLARIMALLPMLELPAEPDAEQQLIYNYLVASAKELDHVIHSITDATCSINLK
ncbi:PAS domain-containing protein [Dyadobacter alkalitolerans]|uniref:PAS domain-containing protein n=1 Tax=Dyadobacter alkalitolerans TaxID=492736 RepID=UPI00041A710C|nr:PAS domain-containing protein [Dyadobacter alkalitolerans]